MKFERSDRRKIFYKMLNNSKNVVAEVLILTASHGFFKDVYDESNIIIKMFIK